MKVVVLGGGGHAVSIIDAVRSAGRGDILAGVVEAPGASPPAVTDLPHVGSDRDLAALRAGGIGGFMLGIGNSGGASVRRRLFDLAVAAGLEPVAVVHPAATVSATARLGRGSVVLARAIAGPLVIVGEGTIVNTGAVLEHHVDVGRHAHVGPGVLLCGHVRVGDDAVIGAGAIVREELTVGAAASIALGAVVARDVAAGGFVAGNPARPVPGRPGT